jgi:glucosamine--fructose-6-phosphate aminotransferase (isomerizing)
MSVADDVHAQPDIAERLLLETCPEVERVAAAVQGEFDHVVIVARGSSDNAAVYAKYLFGVANGISVTLAAPSIQTLYRRSVRIGRSLVIGISQSGASPDVVETVAAARDQGLPTIAITNIPSSVLARAAEHLVPLNTGPEAVAATKTYTASLLAVAMLSAAWGGRPGLADLARVPALMSRALETAADAEVVARRLAAIDRCVVLGRGFGYATAKEWALKLQELARVVALPASGADFRHEPIALVDSDLPVFATTSADPAGDDVMAVLDDVRRFGDGPALVVADGPHVGLDALLYPNCSSAALAPLVSIIPIQLFVIALARAKGLDPDAPPNLVKVTETR